MKLSKSKSDARVKLTLANERTLRHLAPVTPYSRNCANIVYVTITLSLVFELDDATTGNNLSNLIFTYIRTYILTLLQGEL